MPTESFLGRLEDLEARLERLERGRGSGFVRLSRVTGTGRSAAVWVDASGVTRVQASPLASGFVTVFLEDGMAFEVEESETEVVEAVIAARSGSRLNAIK